MTPQESGRFQRWQAFCGACRQVFGMPDYERYLAHAAATHPGQPVMTREAYSAWAIERRYGGASSGRCC
ncbi:MAG TPA: YbdD/YjiX family protein [Ramlibacter sp.]|uniref:YbdD/YjiX family protein n=1 Tax=Ramlibacter sp. TaxID=1917967 RepID=UPI002D7FB4A9|nr:YbdD/YjiX family protein [Ramlibacter sp.]HET8746038.1 YbdD/YjiX family protein [Ramlibacter sp.]